MKFRNVVAGFICIATAACTPAWTGGTAPVSAATPQPSRTGDPASFRVIESATGATVPFSSLVARAAAADVVYFGEQHDDPETHFLELALLEGLGRRHEQVILSLEMFERDVQPQLDRYLAGAIGEDEFLANGRPWPRYATDYRPMVQLARARGWKVVAANIPRPMASAISRGGMSVLDTLTSFDRRNAAATMNCAASGAYYNRFAEEMGGHSAGGGPPTAADSAASRAMIGRFYEAQCAKDETMAEAIWRQLSSVPRGTVVMHVNGAFHSDYGQGTAERVRRRATDLRSLLITVVPVADPATARLGNEAAKADYVIFTRRKP